MKIDKRSMKISIMRGPYNAYHAEAFGLVFKLSYVFEGVEGPRLEVFLDDDEAKEKEWNIYGALLDDSDERFAEMRFNAIGEESEFQIRSSRFRIAFGGLHHEQFIYPDGSKELMPVYDFLVKSLV